MTERRGAARLAVLAAALVGLLALVALASSAGVPWSGTSGDSEGRSLALVGRILVNVVVLAFVAAFVAAFVLRMRRARVRLANNPAAQAHEEVTSRLARFLMRVGPYVLLAAILAVILLFAWQVDRRFPRGEPVRDGGAEGGDPSRSPALAPPSDAAGWMLATAGGLALLALAFATAVPVARRRFAEWEADDRQARAFTRVLDESIDDLRAEPDPRRAVIAAYARMERGLAARGHARRAFEAPLEYLARVLTEVTADRESVRRLTALFERAKFSRHPVGPDAKDEAIDCLVAIRGELT